MSDNNPVNNPHGLSQAVLEARHWNTARDLDLDVIWTKLESWLLEHFPEGLASLRPGANQTEIAAFEASIGLTLPPEVRFLYSLHDGQQDVLREGMYFGMIFQSLERSLRDWQVWQGVVTGWGEQEFSLVNPFASYPKGMTKKQYVNKHWIPLLYDGNTDGLAVDLDPDENGFYGQVISYGRDRNEHYVVAPSVVHLFDRYLQLLELGQFTLLELPDDLIGQRSLAPKVPYLLESLHWSHGYLRQH
jgi:cell wall assembly regulator SMI1